MNHNDEHFFVRTFGYFDHHEKATDARGKHQFFTFPQFTICMWNFLSLDHVMLGEWMFRCYFGGTDCAHHRTATSSEVFDMIDVVYGLSKKYKSHHDSYQLEKLLGTVNTHDNDVKKCKALVNKNSTVTKLPSGDKTSTVNIEQFRSLLTSSPKLINRIFSVQANLRRDLGGERLWKNHQARR